jgi:hypothetical protein
MRVFMRYGRDELALGEMPVIPLPEDRVGVELPGADGETTIREMLTVGRRIFVRRLQPAPDMPDLQVMDWVCILTSQETR